MYRFIICCLVAAVASATPARAQSTSSSPATASSAAPLVVGVKLAPPFVTATGDGHYDGLAISLWQQVAAKNHWRYRYQRYDLTGLLDAVKNDKVAVGLGAITTTAQREQVLDFAHPMTSSGLGIAVRDAHGSGWLAVAQALVSPAFLKVIGTLALLLLVVGVLVWLFEHEDNPEQFGGSRRHGIFSGFWWAMVTMTTVGYGDTAPRTVGGRILGMVWMLTALIIASFFTASITSALTVGQLSRQVSSADDLGHMRIASVNGTTSAQWLHQQGWNFTAATNLDAALGKLAAGRVDAVVYDIPLMKWQIRQHYRGQLEVLPLVLERQDYAFALPEHSPLRQAINTSLLRQINAPDWMARVDRYFSLGAAEPE